MIKLAGKAEGLSDEELIKECIKSAVNGVMRLKGKSEVFNCDGEK